MNICVANGRPYLLTKQLHDICDYMRLMKIHYPLEEATGKPSWACKDEDVAELSKAVSKFITDNKTLFAHTTTDEKIAIIFDAYRDAYLKILYKDPKFKKAIVDLKQSDLKHIGSSDEIEQAARLMVFSRIKTFHSTLIQNAVENHLKLEQFSVDYNRSPDTYAHRDSELQSFTCFFSSKIKP